MCDCNPGSNENGWHETRGEKCAEQDRQAWADFYERVPGMILDLSVRND